jgi:hypothetical protein
MAYVKISQLPIGLPNSTSIFPFVDSGVTYHGAISAITSNISGLIEVTYSELVDKITGETLTSGQFYLITDFQTCYDQPDYDYNNNAILTGNYKEAEVDPIIVLATGLDTISTTAYQPSYPKDRIQYDWTFSATEVTQGVAYGRISERIDEFGNRTDYDHRTIQFKRYRFIELDLGNPHNGTVIVSTATGQEMLVSGSSTSFESFSVGQYVGFIDNDYKVYEITNIVSDTEMTITGLTLIEQYQVKIYPTNTRNYTSYKQNNISTTDYEEYYTFNGEGVNLNNYIDNFSNYLYEVYFILSNNVFLLNNNNNKFGYGTFNNSINNGAYNNLVGPSFYNNIFENGFYNNNIGSNFNYNRISSSFYDNQIGTNFQYNYFTNYNFYNNTIENNFYGNIIIGNFNDNQVNRYFNNNTIGQQFYKNTIGEQFENNTIYELFYDNQIFNEFRGNIIYQSFNTNKLDWGFVGNQISGSCNGNTFGPNIDSNDFLGNVFGNTFKGSVVSNTIGDNFGFNNIGYNFQNNTIGENFGYGASAPQGNIIGNYFQNNTIGEYFYNNTISDNFGNNTIDNYFQWNIINTSINSTCLSTGMLYDITTVNVFKNKNGDNRLSYYDESDILTIETLTEAPCLGGLNALDIPENDLNFGLIL